MLWHGRCSILKPCCLCLASQSRTCGWLLLPGPSSSIGSGASLSTGSESCTRQCQGVTNSIECRAHQAARGQPQSMAAAQSASVSKTACSSSSKRMDSAASHERPVAPCQMTLKLHCCCIAVLKTPSMFLPRVLAPLPGGFWQGGLRPHQCGIRPPPLDTSNQASMPAPIACRSKLHSKISRVPTPLPCAQIQAHAPCPQAQIPLVNDLHHLRVPSRLQI